METERASNNPFKPVELLLTKVVNRYFSAKNRKKDLDGYAHFYVSFQSFLEKIADLNAEVERGMVDNGILDQPRNTHYMRDTETKIEAIPADISADSPLYDEDTNEIVVFEVSKMNMDDFGFLTRLKKDNTK